MGEREIIKCCLIKAEAVCKLLSLVTLSCSPPGGPAGSGALPPGSRAGRGGAGEAEGLGRGLQGGEGVGVSLQALDLWRGKEKGKKIPKPKPQAFVRSTVREMTGRKEKTRTAQILSFDN